MVPVCSMADLIRTLSLSRRLARSRRRSDTRSLDSHTRADGAGVTLSGKVSYTGARRSSGVSDGSHSSGGGVRHTRGSQPRPARTRTLDKNGRADSAELRHAGPVQQLRTDRDSHRLPRCVADFQKCYAGADVPEQCALQKEDYLECLHHTKEVRSPSLSLSVQTRNPEGSSRLFPVRLRLVSTRRLRPSPTRSPLDDDTINLLPCATCRSLEQ